MRLLQLILRHALREHTAQRRPRIGGISGTQRECCKIAAHAVGQHLQCLRIQDQLAVGRRELQPHLGPVRHLVQFQLGQLQGE